MMMKIIPSFIYLSLEARSELTKKYPEFWSMY